MTYKITIQKGNEKPMTVEFEHADIEWMVGTRTKIPKPGDSDFSDPRIWASREPNGQKRMQIRAWNGMEKYEDLVQE